MNISQHAIIPLGYPVRTGYYYVNGTYNSSASYASIGLSPQFGMNRAFNCVPSASYGVIRNFNVADGELTLGATNSFNVESQVIDVSVRDVFSFFTQRSTLYNSYMPYVFWLMYKANTPAVTSLSLGNPFSPDVMEDEEEMI